MILILLMLKKVDRILQQEVLLKILRLTLRRILSKKERKSLLKMKFYMIRVLCQLAVEDLGKERER